MFCICLPFQLCEREAENVEVNSLRVFKAWHEKVMLLDNSSGGSKMMKIELKRVCSLGKS